MINEGKRQIGDAQTNENFRDLHIHLVSFKNNMLEFIYSHKNLI
jgi:hypothetical protein